MVCQLSSPAVEVCTDKAEAMLGKNVGFHAKVKSLNTGPITG